MLAYLLGEPGKLMVAQALRTGASMSSVNVAEVCSRLVDFGADADSVARQVTARVDIEPFLAADAVEVARLRRATRGSGLSIGDRSCLALGYRRRLPMLTSDSAWSSLPILTDGGRWSGRLSVVQIR